MKYLSIVLASAVFVLSAAEPAAAFNMRKALQAVENLGQWSVMAQKCGETNSAKDIRLSIKSAIDTSQHAWRRVVGAAVENGVAVPAFASALAYYDAYRSPTLPVNLLQAQRDYFGAHTYERTDRPRGEFFHTNWKE